LAHNKRICKFNSCIKAVYKHKNTVLRTQISGLKYDKNLSLETQKHTKSSWLFANK